MSVVSDDMFAVTVGSAVETFSVDTDLAAEELVALLADRLQAILMEGRREMTPACPLHAGAHPLVSSVADGRAVWMCPSGNAVLGTIIPSD
jgi:hypothetical protein